LDALRRYFAARVRGKSSALFTDSGIVYRGALLWSISLPIDVGAGAVALAITKRDRLPYTMFRVKSLSYWSAH